MAGQIKVINDPIHGHISLSPVCQRIVDSKYFQRLRRLKQLGMVYYVYPGAAHNRFEHCLGTYHLAGLFARMLRDNQGGDPTNNDNQGGDPTNDGNQGSDPTNDGNQGEDQTNNENSNAHKINDKDIMCVEIAGLCHDLGHGPFSHVFDRRFMPMAGANDWKHEDMSLTLFAAIVEELKLTEEGLLSDDDVTFIKEMIYGKPLKDGTTSTRASNKTYLLQIVSNEETGVDVDKMDYFARDCHHLGFKNNFDHIRYMTLARAIKVDGKWRICVRDKEVPNLYNMYLTRYTLTRFAYNHKVNRSMELMLTDALKAAKDFEIRVNVIQRARCGRPRATPRAFKISECKDNVDAYNQLDDTILARILEAQGFDDAKEIIVKIQNRQSYPVIYESPTSFTELLPEKEDMKTRIKRKYDKLKQVLENTFPGLQLKNITTNDIEFEDEKCVTLKIFKRIFDALILEIEDLREYRNLDISDTQIVRQRLKHISRTLPGLVLVKDLNYGLGENVQHCIQTESDNLKNAHGPVIERLPMIKAIIDQMHDLAENYVIQINYPDFGNKGKDPLEELYIYTKGNEAPRQIKKGEFSKILLPLTYQEAIIRVFCRKSKPDMDEKLGQLVKKSFEAWFSKNQKVVEGLVTKRIRTEANKML